MDYILGRYFIKLAFSKLDEITSARRQRINRIRRKRFTIFLVITLCLVLIYLVVTSYSEVSTSDAKDILKTTFASGSYPVDIEENAVSLGYQNIPQVLGGLPAVLSAVADKNVVSLFSFFHTPPHSTGKSPPADSGSSGYPFLRLSFSWCFPCPFIIQEKNANQNSFQFP